MNVDYMHMVISHILAFTTVVLFPSNQALGCNRTIQNKCNFTVTHPFTNTQMLLNFKSCLNNHFRTRPLVLNLDLSYFCQAQPSPNLTGLSQPYFHFIQPPDHPPDHPTTRPPDHPPAGIVVLSQSVYLGKLLFTGLTLSTQSSINMVSF